MWWVLLTGFSCNHPATKSTKVKITSQKELSENIRLSDSWNDTLSFADVALVEDTSRDSKSSDLYQPQEITPWPWLDFFLLKLIDSNAVFTIKKIDEDGENFFPYREITDELNNQLSILPFLGIPLYDAEWKLLEVVDLEPWKNPHYVSKFIMVTTDGITQEMLIAHERSLHIMSLDKTPSRTYIQKFLRSCVKGVEIIYPSLEDFMDSTDTITTHKNR
jgi:hypothetical protein